MKHTLRLIEGNNSALTAHPVGNRIRDFLAGDNDGSELFAALYGHALREPIPRGFGTPLFSHLIKSRCPRWPSSPEPGNQGRSLDE
jgi:hypothetical protein